MNRNKVRYYLHNLDGLKQEIADINADLEQYRAMSSESFLVNQDPDPYSDAPDPSIISPKGKVKPFTNRVANYNPGHYSDHSSVEALVAIRVDFIAKLEQDLFNKKTILAAINCVLYYLEGWERQTDKKLIHLRYKEHLPWHIVARQMSYEIITLKHKDCKIIDEIISNYNIRLN